jgi:hypothetical protein
MPDNFAQIIATMQENISAADDAIIMGVVSVAQALDELLTEAQRPGLRGDVGQVRCCL